MTPTIESVTATIKKRAERLTELCLFIEDESRRMTAVENAIDERIEINAQVDAILSPQQWATTFKPEYLDALVAKANSLLGNIDFAEDIIRSDSDMLRTAREDGLLDADREKTRAIEGGPHGRTA